MREREREGASVCDVERDSDRMDVRAQETEHIYIHTHICISLARRGETQRNRAREFVYICRNIYVRPKIV